MSDTLSKYAGNQFDTVTVDSFPLMGEILLATQALLIPAALAHPTLVPAQTAINTAIASWNVGETALANAEAAQLSSTPALTDKLASLTRKPDIDTNSVLDAWEIAILGVAAKGSTLYKLLLPYGRETLTTGTLDEQIDAIRDFGVRLANQATKPTLVSLGSTQVTPFAVAARALRTTQSNAKANVANARINLEILRKSSAAELYAMVGDAIRVFKGSPELVDSVIPVHLLRGPAQAVPAAPLTTLWTPATHTLSTTALPDGATRLEAWRQGEGGAPERLAVGDTDELSVQIPAIFTFDAGKVYDLWFEARNSKGTSGPGPKTTWTAP